MEARLPMVELLQIFAGLGAGLLFASEVRRWLVTGIADVGSSRICRSERPERFWNAVVGWGLVALVFFGLGVVPFFSAAESSGGQPSDPRFVQLFKERR